MQRNRGSKTWRGRWPVVVAIALLAGCTPELPESSGECWTLARVPGPEDLVLLPKGDAVLVSSQDRRADRQPQGAIWYVPLDPAESDQRARPLKLRGRRDECSFHPHGIDLVETAGGRTLLYVINHHEPADASGRKGCFKGSGKVKSRAEITSIEVFEVRDDGLLFIQRLAHPAVLSGGNDLVALANGDVWVSNPPPGTVARFLDLSQSWRIGGFDRSKVVRFECRERSERDFRCLGEWHEVALPFDPPLRYANGIEIRGEPGQNEATLYVASSGGKRIHTALVHGRGRLEEVGEIGLNGMPDNLTWTSDRQENLLIAVHPHKRRYLQHARSPSTPSPSEVHAIDASAPRGRARVLFSDSGDRISAVSAAAMVGNDLLLAQVFEPDVLRCRVHAIDEPGEL